MKRQSVVYGLYSRNLKTVLVSSPCLADEARGAWHENLRLLSLLG